VYGETCTESSNLSFSAIVKLKRIFKHTLESPFFCGTETVKTKIILAHSNPFTHKKGGMSLKGGDISQIASIYLIPSQPLFIVIVLYHPFHTLWNVSVHIMQL
jgi:hypothetical protein